MLSILIPIFNFDCTELVQTLHKQCLDLHIEFEIICLDDGSQQKYLDVFKVFIGMPHVTYTPLEHNLGRAKIRNKLAEQAQYEQVLYLDCDSGVTRPDFIKTYVEQTQSDALIYGGRNYFEHPPTDQAKFLHWFYGHKREALPVSSRIKDPYLNFLTNNFLAPRRLMLKFPFNESVQGYGYEDTAFANIIKSNGIKIHHIENPTIHLCLENNIEFLHKTENAILNLSKLYKSGEIQSSRLINTYRIFKKWNLLGVLNIMTKKNKSRFLENLQSQKPRLIYFNVLKLWLFSQCINDQEESFF